MQQMTDNNKKSCVEAHDIWAAFSLLTRIRIPVNHNRAGNRASNATWAYPLVGAIVGAISGLFLTLMSLIGLPSGFCAAITLLVLIAITGAILFNVRIRHQSSMVFERTHLYTVAR